MIQAKTLEMFMSTYNIEVIIFFCRYANKLSIYFIMSPIITCILFVLMCRESNGNGKTVHDSNLPKNVN